MAVGAGSLEVMAEEKKEEVDGNGNERDQSREKYIRENQTYVSNW